MASTDHAHSQPGDILLVVHDFAARSGDELSLARGDRIELIERDDDFGDGWFLGKHLQHGSTGLFPEVYTTPAPKATLTSSILQRQNPISRSVSTPADVSTLNEAGESLGPTPVEQPEPPEPTPSAMDPATPRARDTVASLPNPTPVTSTAAPSRVSVPSTTTRSLSMSLSGAQNSPVMNETLSVIDEHITDMHTPRHSIVATDRRGTNDSGSEYSSHHRLSYINGEETDEEEQNHNTEEEVSSWTPQQVAQYLEGVGVEKKHCEILQEEEISGDVLLAMEQSTLFAKEFELGPMGRRIKTWTKIKDLQQEVRSSKRAPPKSVSEYSATEEPTSDSLRNRSTSVGTVLPRIPSLMETSNSRSPSRQTVQRGSSQALPGKVEVNSPLSNMTVLPGRDNSPRPSAASVRSLNHRRHSSIDYAAATPTTPNTPATTMSAHTSHRKQPSFDRNWAMNTESSSTIVNGRPASSAHMHSLSSESTSFNPATREFGMTVLTPSDLDRGYFSGGELENRRSRNVLKKKDGTAHSRNSSYSSVQAKQSASYKRHSRIESEGSLRDPANPVSPAAQVYYGTKAKPKSHRAGSGPEISKSIFGMRERSPTVTKLDHANSPGIDTLTSTPNLAGSETSSTGRASPIPGISGHSIPFFGKKSRSTGLRAISDAVTGSEKALVTSPSETAVSLVKESPIQTPSRTGSSTPSATSTSLDFQKEDLPKAATGGSDGMKSSTGTTRRKSKKTTSAYTRGLQKKTPAEQMNGCDYSGWMKKRSSNLMTTWKTRLFVLRGRRLSYYYSEFDTEEKGLIDISFHRVLPAGNERITGLHATLTGASSSPTSPSNPTLTTTAASDAANATDKSDVSGMFIFKLVPPRSGLSKAVTFTKPTVHYFAVDNIQQGRLWMAALMKATIDRNEDASVFSTYKMNNLISLKKAQETRQRPPALMSDPKEEDEKVDAGEKGLAIIGLSEEKGENGVANGKDEDEQSQDDLGIDATIAGAITAQ